MFKIHRRLEYALLALNYMSRKFPGQVTSAKEICDHFHIPFDPTSRVLQFMAQKGIVQAEQGARGGYKIVRDLNRVTLNDLTELLTGPLKISDCLNESSPKCSLQDHCEISPAIKNLNMRLQKLLDSISIAEALENSSTPKERTIHS